MIRNAGRGFLAALLLSSTTIGAPPEARDTLRIVTIQPPGPVTRGVEVEFVIDVDVTLATEDEALLHLGFNTDDPNRFRMIEYWSIRRGTERVTFKAKVVPPDWGKRGQFAVVVNIGPKEPGVRWSPKTHDRRVIEVTP